MRLKIILLAIIAIFCISCSEKGNLLISPDKKISVNVLNTQGKGLLYKVNANNKSIIDTSNLGINVDEQLLGYHVKKISLVNRSNVSFTFPILGVKKEANYKANIYEFKITELNDFEWFLEFAVSNEGVAFRYRIPGEGKRTVSGESTSIKFPNKTKVWYFERNNDWKLKSYAGEWLSADISIMPTVSIMGPVQGLTLTCQLPNGAYVLLAEAALFSYSGMRLEAIGNNTFRANFSEGDKGFDVDGEIVTPWRCILLSDDLNGLVNNIMVAALNPKPDEKLFTEFAWIKPGKASWYWWSGNFSTFEAEKKTVDNAAKLGFEYTMVDEGWERWEHKWETATQFCTYAKSRGVGVFLWKHSKEINFSENNYAVMAGFLDSVKQTGAVGVKVDFMNGETKSLIDFDEALLKLAAERKLMVNFHGCQKSSGEYRTYPNEVSREGIRGIELNIMGEGPLSASHNAALPFTRYVTGHADYTPLAFTAPGETTWAHQLATLVCFYSPFQCIAENPEYLLAEKRISSALQFIKIIPTVWDETIILPESEIGEMALIARRKGHEWFLGVLNGGNAKHLNLQCDFLAEGTYKTELFLDDKEVEPIILEGLNPRANLTKYSTAVPFKKEEKLCDNKTVLTLDIDENGGAAIWFKPSE